MVTINRNNYTLLLSYNPCEIFEYYNIEEMHGLNLYDCKKHINNTKQSYISGWCNYHPQDTKLEKPIDKLPFVFINLSRCTDVIVTTTNVFHEMMHLSGIMYNSNWNNQEEEMITYAEIETLEVARLICNIN